MPDFDGNCTPGALGQPGIAKRLLGPITGVQLPSFFTPRTVPFKGSAVAISVVPISR